MGNEPKVTKRQLNVRILIETDVKLCKYALAINDTRTNAAISIIERAVTPTAPQENQHDN